MSRREEIPLWLEQEIRVREPSLVRVLGRPVAPGDAYQLLRAFDILLSQEARRHLAETIGEYRPSQQTLRQRTTKGP